MKKIEPVIFRRGQKVHLCIVLKAYLPLITKWINDPEVTRYLGSYMPQYERNEEQWLERLAEKKNTDMVFALVTKNGEMIGIMGLHQINSKDGTATTGALIGEKRFWGRGYGSEAKMLLLDYAFNTLNLRKICSAALAFNGRSVRYSKKCGYEEEGVRKAQFYKNGAYHDEILLAVFRDQWLPFWKRFQKSRK